MEHRQHMQRGRRQPLPPRLDAEQISEGSSSVPTALLPRRQHTGGDKPNVEGSRLGPSLGLGNGGLSKGRYGPNSWSGLDSGVGAAVEGNPYMAEYDPTSFGDLVDQFWRIR